MYVRKARVEVIAVAEGYTARVSGVFGTSREVKCEGGIEGGDKGDGGIGYNQTSSGSYELKGGNRGDRDG